MGHFHDPGLVLLSIAVAIFASYTALHLATRVQESNGGRRYWWLAAASVALGGGIWAMHFVAMLAFKLPNTDVSYDLPVTLFSLALPIAVTGFGFAVVARGMTTPRLLLSGLVMGAGIVGMHYTGMAAIRFDGTLHHDSLWVTISVLIAVVAATAALWLAIQNTTMPQRWIAAVVMGIAISGMHYSAMAGATFDVLHNASSHAATSGFGQTALAIWVTAATLVILMLGLAAAILDRRITAHSQRQRDALKQSEQRFRILVQGVTDYAIFMLDADGRVSNWNPGAQRIKGYTQEEVIGQHFSMFYTDEDRAASIPEDALATAERTGRFEAEGKRVRKDGNTFWAHTVIQAIRDEAGKLVGFAKITRDVTESREARERLEEARQQLAQSQKMEALGQLTGGVAHDFNNLLMIVLGNLDTAARLLERNEGNSDRMRRAIENALHGARRGATLTKSLLAFSRRQPLEPKVIDVSQTIKDVAPLLRRALGEDRPLEIVGAAGGWNIEVDPGQLESALLNLAINARDAMPTGGKATLEAENVFVGESYAAQHLDVLAGQYCVISFTDTGVGMSKEILPQAFEPFFTTKAPGQGTGLGLSQVYGFVKQSGGHVNLYSEVGQGTCVKMYFPRVYEAPLDAHPPPANAVALGNSEHIVVVEDDADVREFVSGTLSELNYKVVAFPSGEDAVVYLRSGRTADAMLTDVIMPGMNGRELADAARAIAPNMKVIFMTGYSRNAIVHHGRLDPGVILLQKPFSREELANRVQGLFAKPND